jgi:uncharacterized protein YegJ (DUF2314 family)
MRMGLITMDTPYYTDVAATADSLREFGAKRAVQEHQAWLSVDLVGDAPAGGKEAAYAFLAKLAGQFADANTLAVMRTSDGRVMTYRPEFSEMLRRGDTAAVFGASVKDTVVQTKGEDPELEAAAAEARRRWPEFLKAFKERQALQGFAVKKRYVADGRAEHMWVEVKRIDGQAIFGSLDSNPETLVHMKAGDDVTLDSSEVEDWVYSDGKRMVGGFQGEVLKRRQH